MRRKILTRLLWEPLTWIPFVLATAGWVAGLPWWANTLTFAGAIAWNIHFWGQQSERLLALLQSELDTEASEAKQRREGELQARMEQLTPEAGRALRIAYSTEQRIQQHVRETPWLAQFGYHEGATRLVDELELIAAEITAPTLNLTERKDAWHARREEFALATQALEDTLKTAKETLAQTELFATGQPGARSLAEELLAKNRAAQKAIRTLRPPEPPDTISNHRS